MTLNRSKTAITLAASLLLVAAHATTSDARTNAQRLSSPYSASSAKAPANVYPYQTSTAGTALTEDASTHNGG